MGCILFQNKNYFYSLSGIAVHNISWLNSCIFSDDKIVSSINSLGISLGNEVDNGLENIKTLDLNSLLEASKTKLNKDKQECSNEDDASETNSDVDLDQDAIQHLVGDIADEIFGE
jgi:hypothetical protein